MTNENSKVEFIARIEPTQEVIGCGQNTIRALGRQYRFGIISGQETLNQGRNPETPFYRPLVEAAKAIAIYALNAKLVPEDQPFEVRPLKGLELI